MSRKTDVTITYLEQTSRPILPHPPQPPGKVAILRAEHPPTHYYRYLYDLVGRRWHWVTRRKISDMELAEIIHDPRVHIYVLYAGGVPAGFVELDARQEEAMDLRFFGVAPDFLGKGFGRYFLTHTIDLAWSLNPKRVRLETCTLDHPAALPLYQKLGFTVFDQRKGEAELLEA
jgi:GNAT superfamily N-acetyltransferase